jgi:hypothetical protein
MWKIVPLFGSIQTTPITFLFVFRHRYKETINVHTRKLTRQHFKLDMTKDFLLLI